MDVPSALRLFSNKMLKCIGDLIAGRTPNGDTAPYLAGVQRYLTPVRMYASIFMSKRLSYAERIRRAAYVVTYLRLWRQWVKHQRDFNVRQHFITLEAFKDVLMSCHFAVLLIKYYAQRLPGRVALWTAPAQTRARTTSLHLARGS